MEQQQQIQIVRNLWMIVQHQVKDVLLPQLHILVNGKLIWIEIINRKWNKM
ncbi:unnamed protein product [Paramecium sonneborni]|uniref:Uncharacterized protein n=1 Tax=Paramecium sonneborni TaxID=65129 RepID=A0A8S1RS37_9CILI|nr:unnamed protein product [Paramecium sonneborni]